MKTAPQIDPETQTLIALCYALERIWVSESIREYLRRAVPFWVARLDVEGGAYVQERARYFLALLGTLVEERFEPWVEGCWIPNRATNRFARSLAEVVAALVLIAGEPFEVFGEVFDQIPSK